MPAFCSLCVSDEYTTEGATDDGRVFVTCFNSREHGPDGYTWEPTPEKSGRSRGDGLGSELEIWDKLLECIPTDGIPHAYGEVEDLFFERYPTETALLQERYGHKWREGKKTVNQYSMSVYLAARLRDLAREQAVDLSWGPAEGPWAHNGVISYWARG